MTVKKHLTESMRRRALHMTLLDPTKQSPEKAGDIADTAACLGTDAIMVGGSTGITQRNLDETVLSIKSKVKVPVIYFPSGAHAISSHCDAIYFMSMLNSRNVKNVIREQVTAAPIVSRLGLEMISMGYVIVEPGMKVGEVGEADLVRRNDIQTAVAYGLAAQFLGMDCLYLEAGSGAPDPVPPEMIKAVKAKVSIPLLVGGGIRTPQSALEARCAGANVIVTGTVVENGGFSSQLERIIQVVRG
jgi:phosphoglycerol geranylgeranyltransferase